MKPIFLTIALIAYTLQSFAQKETLDLISYNAPANWKKEITENSTCYTIINNKTRNWCRINILKSTNSKGGIDQDFESEWQDLVVGIYKPTSAPHVNETVENGGWKIRTGGAKFIFENKDAMVIQTTASGYNRCVSIIAITNSKDYIKDIDTLLASVDLVKQEISTQPVTAANASIIGSWGKSNALSQLYNQYGSYSYIKKQYTFNANGSYSFIEKIFSQNYSETQLIKEKGSFTITGNTITITPKSSVIEAWSKKKGGDDWDQLKSSEKRPLEVVSYLFSISDNNLLLQTTKQTERDGRFTTGNTYSYGPRGTFTPIKLPGEG